MVRRIISGLLRYATAPTIGAWSHNFHDFVNGCFCPCRSIGLFYLKIWIFRRKNYTFLGFSEITVDSKI